MQKVDNFLSHCLPLSSHCRPLNSSCMYLFRLVNIFGNSFLAAVPVTIWFGLRQFNAKFKLITAFCVYGYSLLPFVPAAVSFIKSLNFSLCDCNTPSITNAIAIHPISSHLALEGTLCIPITTVPLSVRLATVYHSRINLHIVFTSQFRAYCGRICQSTRHFGAGSAGSSADNFHHHAEMLLLGHRDSPTGLIVSTFP